ncbi:MAG: hypothetical protein JSW28_05260 [Thermoplasmata archaeon]|nr:MAG: hypothetical protein JSW28_05260 [Thermoplasmata archaeon]
MKSSDDIIQDLDKKGFQFMAWGLLILLLIFVAILILGFNSLDVFYIFVIVLVLIISVIGLAGALFILHRYKKKNVLIEKLDNWHKNEIYPAAFFIFLIYFWLSIGIVLEGVLK